MNYTFWRRRKFLPYLMACCVILILFNVLRGPYKSAVRTTDATVDLSILEKNMKTLKDILMDSIGVTQWEVNKKMKHSVPQLTLDHLCIKNLHGHNISKGELKTIIREEGYVVPSAIHYLLPFAVAKLEFHQLICILSGFWIIQPRALIFWYNEHPSGLYWDYLLKNLTQHKHRVFMIQREPPRKIYGISVTETNFISDIARIEALLTFGGIYMDLDVIVLRSFNELRNYPVTMSRDGSSNLQSSIILAQPDAPLLGLWHLTYQMYGGLHWEDRSANVALDLASQFDELIHIEVDTMNTQNADEIGMIFGVRRTFNWRKNNYCVHLWHRKHGVHYNMNNIRHLVSAFGDMSRWILWGIVERPETKRPTKRTVTQPTIEVSKLRQ